MELLQNKRICLRAPEPEDLELLYRWENNSDWWGLSNTLVPYSRYQLKAYIAESHRDIFELRQLRLMVAIRTTAETVGTVDLYDFDPHHGRAGLGILIDPRYQQQGIGREALALLEEYAFSFLRLHQLFVYIPAGNTASKALFTACDFVQTGVLTDWITLEDGYSNVLVMQKIKK